MFNFERLEVWRRSIAFAQVIHDSSRTFPEDERFGLVHQIRRSAVSIASNIAEGAARPSADFVRFLGYATGSLYEVVTQAVLARQQNYIDDLEYGRIYSAADEIARMLSGLRRSLGE